VSNEAIARRYARAIFEIGRDENNLARLSQEIAAFADVYVTNAELRSVLDSPLVELSAREAVLGDIGERLSVSPTAANTLKLLVRRRRTSVLPEIARELARLVDEENKTVRAEVLSAAPLSDDYLSRLKAELEKSTGQKVIITYRQDPSLIAGVITKIGDRVIDGSVLSRLKNFREQLMTH
jgi:F-type H+-transporting ATPase subunit delta